METLIDDLEAFIRYFHGQRRQTQWIIDSLPPEKAGWRPWPDEPSPAEIICRIAAGQLMYATVVAHDYWMVDEYEKATGTWDSAMGYFHSKTEEALDLLRPLSNNVLKSKRRRPDGNLPMEAWRFLAAMLDHEIAHRSQLGCYLMLLNIRRPQMGGATIEAVRKVL